MYPPLVEHELILYIHSTYPYLAEDAILTRLPVRTDYLFQDPKFQNRMKSIRLIPFVRRVVDTWDVPEAVEEVDNSDEIPMPLLFAVFRA